MKDALIVSLLSVVPRKSGARSMGWFARSRASRLMTRAFVRAYGVDLSEAEGSLADYPTLEALFTRSLKPTARPIAPDADAMASPVDGRVAYVGPTVDGSIEVAPGRRLDIAELVGHPLDGVQDVAVLYLSPKDYHRVHVPREGQATRWSYLPGTLWPVFPAAVRKVDNLFARNERFVVQTETEGGPLDVVLVGAFGVGRISTPLCDLLTNTGGHAAAAELTPPQPLERGALLGTFHLGSTVVLVSPAGRWNYQVEAGEPVRMGQLLASLPKRLTG